MRPTILIVGDDPATQAAFTTVLEREDCELDLVPNGETAIGALERHRYDAIILDLSLPRMSGTDLMEWIASTIPESLHSVIVVTGLEASEIRKLFPEICDTLSKPVMPGRLVAAVRRCLRGQSDSGVSGISVA